MRKKKNILDVLVGLVLKTFFSLVLSVVILVSMLTTEFNFNISLKREKNIETLKSKSFAESVGVLVKNGVKGYKYTKSVS